MFSNKSFLFALLSSALYLVYAAPANPLDANTLLKNGQDAQGLNAQFQSLKASDDCTTGQLACINTSKAECIDSQWKLTRCPRSTQCFALPSIQQGGTIISCTSERSALSVINATGAVGGIASINGSNTTVPLPTTNGDNGNDSNNNASGSSSSIASATSTGNVNAPTTVTVTVTPPFSTALPAQTITLPPAEASSLISSLTAGGSASVVSVILPSVSQSAVASVGSADSASTGKPPALTIKLTAAPLPTQSSTAPGNAAAAVATSQSSDSYNY